MAGLHMDEHGWVEVEELLHNVTKYPLTRQLLEEIVTEDKKDRYQFSEDGRKIRCCQGHFLPWVDLGLEPVQPPDVLYHGTTAEAAQQIMENGRIDKMRRNHVHMQADTAKAWQSARRRRGKTGVLLVIDAKAMGEAGYLFYRSENQVWLTDHVPAAFIREILRD